MSTKQFPSPDTVSIDNGKYKVELVLPETALNDKILGCRFIKAGWMTSLTIQNKDKSVELFKTDSLWPNYASFGCPQEFTPAIPLSSDGSYVEALRVGAGVVRYKPNDPLHAEIVERFAWQTTFKPNGDGLAIINSQSTGVKGILNGYGYNFSHEIVIKHNSPSILLRQKLENTGSKRIQTSNYMHPFFECGPDVKYAIGKKTFIPVAKQKNATLLSGNDFEVSSTWVSVKFNNNLQCRISSDKKLSKVILWKMSKKKCFAVEPFVDLNLQPGETANWTWEIKTRQ